jgi:hypothetical protein
MDRHAASQYYGSTPGRNVPATDDGWTRVGSARGEATTYQPPPVAPPATTSPPPAQPPTVPAPLRGYDLDGSYTYSELTQSKIIDEPLFA